MVSGAGRASAQGPPTGLRVLTPLPTRTPFSADLRDDPEHGALLWHPEQLGVLRLRPHGGPLGPLQRPQSEPDTSEEGPSPPVYITSWYHCYTYQPFYF